MTRKEFAKIWLDHWVAGGYMKEGQTLLEATEKRRMGFNLTGIQGRAIAEVATNGFTPEPEISAREALKRIDFWVQQYQNNPAPPKLPARPFVGSHNLPYDSDWDG